MAYTSYVNDIKEKNTSITEFNTNTSKVDLESIWEGKASAKQREILSSLQSELTIQLSQLTNLNTAMSKIDEYDKLKNDISNLKNQLSALNNNDANYTTKSTELNNKIKTLNTQKDELKIIIDNELAKITKNYSQQIQPIEKTEVQKTLDTLEDIEKGFSSLKFDILTNKGDKTSSSNAGNIVLDKQGTYYDKEPTPGKVAQKLHVYHNGTRLYDDACITIKKGETIRLTMNLTDNCGEVQLLKRTSADGEDRWRNYFQAHSEPYVNRDKPSTFKNVDNYDWVITGNKVTNGYVILSQTTFHSTPMGKEFKSMYRIRVKVVD